MFRHVCEASCEQFAVVLQAGAEDEVEERGGVSVVDSVFAPGRKIWFRQIHAEMVEFVYGFTGFFEVA